MVYLDIQVYVTLKVKIKTHICTKISLFFFIHLLEASSLLHFLIIYDIVSIQGLIFGFNI